MTSCIESTDSFSCLAIDIKIFLKNTRFTDHCTQPLADVNSRGCRAEKQPICDWEPIHTKSTHACDFSWFFFPPNAERNTIGLHYFLLLLSTAASQPRPYQLFHSLTITVQSRPKLPQSLALSSNTCFFSVVSTSTLAIKSCFQTLCCCVYRTRAVLIVASGLGSTGCRAADPVEGHWVSRCDAAVHACCSFCMNDLSRRVSIIHSFHMSRRHMRPWEAARGLC